MKPAKKKLIIDGQIFQTDAKDRGMGRYSTYLIETLIKQQNFYQEIEVILTDNLPISEMLKKDIADRLAGARLHIFNLWVVKKHRIEDCFDHNQSVLNSYVASQVKKGYIVDFLIPSLFQEPIAAVYPENALKLLVFYDLIPYLYYRRYQPLMNFDNYLKRFKYIFEADKIFAISQTVVDDLHIYLGLPKARLVSIDGAAIRSNRPPQKPALNLPSKFILMPTSDDPRKNNLLGVLGFEEFRSRLKQSGYKLVITSKIDKREREHLQLFSEDLIFTGNLPEEQLEWLYDYCQAVLFVSDYEGLGLPILEGVEFGKSVVCSSIGVFKEISEQAFRYCDHKNSTSIADALEGATAKRPDLKVYAKILQRYSWGQTIERFIEALKDYAAEPQSPNKPRLAIFTPNLGAPSGFGEVVATSHATMSEQFSIDYYLDADPTEKDIKPNFLRYTAPMHNARTFGVKLYGTYDAVIYYIGNGQESLQTLKTALYLPGYVVLPGTNIDPAYKAFNRVGLMADERLILERHLNESKELPPTASLTSLSNRQLGVLSYSKYTLKAAENILVENIGAKRANLPVATPTLPSFRSEDRIVIGLLRAPYNKEGKEIVEAIITDPQLNNCLIYIIDLGAGAEDSAERFASYENISVITDPTDFELHTNLSKLDILIDYRPDYTGEVPLQTIQAMGRGVTIMARDIGWYAEQPDEIILKAKGANELFDQLHKLIKSKGELKTRGGRAKEYIGQNYGHGQHALALKEFVGQETNSVNLNHKLARQLRRGRVKSARQYIKFLQRAERS
jgi:glycosyltransferase involved in cell wall biosynthesis